MKRFFLYRVYAERQFVLLAIFTLFIAGQYYYIREQKDDLPFPLWAMYSMPQYQPPGIIYYRIVCNGEELRYANQLKDFEKERIISPLDYYSVIKENSYNDPNCQEIRKEYEGTFSEKNLNRLFYKICNDYHAVEAFPAYLKRSIHTITGKEVNTLKVIKEYYHFSEAGAPVLDAEYTLIDI